jgi:WD40 repeat protein
MTVHGPVSAVAFHPKTPVLVAAYSDRTDPSRVKVVSWEIGEGGSKLIPDTKHQASIDLSSKPPVTRDVALTFSPDGGLLVVQSVLRPQVFRWEAARIVEAEGLVNSRPTAVTSPYLLLRPEFSPGPDSRFMLTAVDWIDVALLDRSSRPYVWMTSFARSNRGSSNLGAFSRDSRLVATIANDDSVHVANLDEIRAHLDPSEFPRIDRILAGMRPPIRVVQFDPTGNQLVTVARDGVIRVWQLNTRKLLEAARRAAGRNLTQAEWNQYFPGVRYQATFPDLPKADVVEGAQ